MDDELLCRVVHRHGDGQTITASVAGEWDATTDGSLVRELRPVLAEGYRNIILDARAVSFCDSVCVGAFVQLQKLTTEFGGWLRVVAPNYAVRRPMEIAGLDQVIEVYGSMAEASGPSR
jgi:anti-sigma B factor antagonist